MTATAPDSTIDGRWELVRAEMNGETSPELVALGVELELNGGAYLVRMGGTITDRGIVEHGENAHGPTLRLTGTSGTNAGRTLAALYQHVGARLRVCYGLDGESPTAFATAPGQPRYLATYRRPLRPQRAP